MVMLSVEVPIYPVLPPAPCHNLLLNQVSFVLCIRMPTCSSRTSRKLAGLDHLKVRQWGAPVVSRDGSRTLHLPRFASLARNRHGSLALLGVVLILIPAAVVPAPLLVEVICLAIAAGVL